MSENFCTVLYELNSHEITAKMKLMLIYTDILLNYSHCIIKSYYCIKVMRITKINGNYKKVQKLNLHTHYGNERICAKL